MSRSRKKNPVCGNAIADSEKIDKRIWHKRLRAREREALCHGAEIFPDAKDCSDAWNMAKDGKHRFDESKHPELMRK